MSSSRLSFTFRAAGIFLRVTEFFILTFLLSIYLIGNAVNVASRIESLTRQLNRFLVFSEAVRDGLSDHWKILKMGDFYAKGREAIVQVYSIDDPLASQKSDFHNLQQEIKDQLELIGNQTIEPCKQRKTLFMLYDR